MHAFATSRLRGCWWIVPALAMCAVVARGQVGQTISPADADQKARATVSPPMVIEDDAAVLERERNLGLIDVVTYPPLRQDNVGLPQLQHWLVDPHADDTGPATRDLLEGWNAGGSSQVIPPDCGIAVSPTHVVVTTNAKLKFFDRTGAQTGSFSWSSFFGGVRPSNTFTSDPKVLYDPDSGRFFVMIVAIRGSDFKTWYLVAVSDDANPSGTWAKYALDSTLNGQNSTNNWSDYPGFGVDSQTVLITANMFSRTTGAYRYVKIRILNKQELINFAATLTWTDIWNVTDPDGGVAFTIQPAQHYGANPFTFLADTNPSSKVTVFGIQDPLGSATLFKKSRNVGNYNQPPAAEQPGGSPRLDTIDNRTYNAVWRNNSIYFAHTVGASSQAAIQWYEVDTTDFPNSATLVQNGSIADPAANHFFPTIAVNASGTVAIGFCRSSTSEFASIYYAAHMPADPAGQVGPLTLIHAGTVHYSGEGGSVVRWGDYSGTVVDPDDQTFWHFNEYPNPNNNGAGWRVWVQHFSVGAPPCPGDFNSDGVVDIGDLSILLGNFGGAGGPADGDMDGDGDVDLTDLASLLAVFGTPCP
ncbi:MAG: hypothetical protein D6725_05435 [Planctomycetota bacterium]|nr:MAG: hypothetical protein D6725_05435 [Planctomycetota bacterium]